MAPDIQSIQKRIQKWFKTETGKKYKNSSSQELIFALEQNNVLTPAEINSLKKHSLFSFGKKVSMSEALPLEGWSIEKESKKLQNLQTKQKNSETSKALELRLNKVKADLDSKVKENRFLRSAWHGIKNAFGFGANSKKVEKALEIEQKKISQINNPEVFKELTGVDYTKENYKKFINGEIKLKSEQALDAYKQGQDGVVDFAADMASGISAVFIYSAAVAAAPFTGGTSIVLGFGAAAVSGAVIKTGLKAGASALSGKKYTKKDLKHDAITGGVSGALGPLTGGLGGVVGKSIATRLGIQAAKEGVKDIAVSGAKTGVKQWIKTAFTNPAGYKYTGGSLLKRAIAFGAEAMTDGTLGGALDGGFRAGYENNWNGEAILEGTVSGGIGGAVMAPAIGGGMKLTGKVGQGLGKKFHFRRYISKKAKLAAEKALLEKYKDYELPNGYKININIAKALETDKEVTLMMLKKFDNISDKYKFFGKKYSKENCAYRNFMLEFFADIPDNTDFNNISSIVQSFKALHKLKTSNSKRYQYFIDSEMMDFIRTGKIIVVYGDDASVHFTPEILKLVNKIKQGEQYIQKLNSTFELDNINKYVGNGEVCEFNDAMYVNNGGVAERLNLKRETFERLFPQLESRAFYQGDVGDCQLVSFIDGLMCTPKGRSTVYKMFEESGEDIILHFNDNPNTRIVFNKGKVIYSKGKYLGKKGTDAPVGLQMLEQGVACRKMGLYNKNDLTQFNISDVTDPKKMVDYLEYMNVEQAADAILGKQIKLIGKADDGMKPIFRSKKNKKIIENFLKENANKDSSIIQIGFQRTLGTLFKLRKYKIYPVHEYLIKGYDAEKGIVHLSNPHYTAYVKDVPIDFVIKYGIVRETNLY